MTHKRLKELIAQAKATRSTRPLSVRLTDEEHERLKVVAKLAGLAPATLARLGVLAAIDDIEEVASSTKKGGPAGKP